MYKVSVLVPIYGVEQYIERCARSLFEQTYPNLEYVFVNDRTPDRSVEILRQVMEDYPKRKDAVIIIDHETNRGLAAARNTCLDNASGEFVSCVDSDDWLELDAIEQLVKKQQETDSDIVSGDMRIHTLDGIEDYFEPKYGSKEQMVLNQLPSTMDHNAIRRIIRRLLFEEHHIRCIVGADMGEDRYQMVQVCYYAKKSCNIDHLVYHHEKRNVGSITSQIQKGKALNRLEQELVNWLAIREFFENKETVYAQATVKYCVECIQMIIKMSLKLHDKDRYCRVVEIIRNSAELMDAMGWRENNFDKIKHHFCLMWINSQGKRLNRFIWRSLRFS